MKPTGGRVESASAKRAAAVTLALLALLAMSFASSRVSAQDAVPRRRLGVGWNDGAPLVTFSARDLATSDARRKLESGLPQTIALTVIAYDEEGSTPVAVAPLSCRVVYDLWEEVFRVQIQTESTDRATSLDSIEEVLEQCLVVRRFPVGRASDFERAGVTRLYFAVLVELNPLSSDTVERIRRWIARPGGRRVEGDAFFGSFVSLFVNRRIGAAERTIRFQSQRVRARRR